MLNWAILMKTIKDKFDLGMLTRDLAFWPELRLLACCVRFLPNMVILYHILSGKSMENGTKSQRLATLKAEGQKSIRAQEHKDIRE